MSTAADGSSGQVDAGPEWSGYGKLDSVQELLDRNKLLIGEINQNHELRTPEALLRNVVLIRELNANVAAVVELYKVLSAAMDAPQPGPEAAGAAAPMPNAA